jgi:hypothetical protein
MRSKLDCPGLYYYNDADKRSEDLADTYHRMANG